MWTNTDFKVSSACTLVVESEERVLAMQSLKSIADNPFAPRRQRKRYSLRSNPLRLKVARQMHTDCSSFKVNSVPRGPKLSVSTTRYHARIWHTQMSIPI